MLINKPFISNSKGGNIFQNNFNLFRQRPSTAANHTIKTNNNNNNNKPFYPSNPIKKYNYMTIGGIP